MNWIGDYPEDFTTVCIYFTTHDSNGAPVAPLSAFEAADVSIYKNGSAVQKTTTNGVTMTSPFDSLVGLHCVVIDTSNDTGDTGFWTTGGGGVYTVILNPDTETVNGQTALKVLATFGIALSPALRPTVAGRTLDVSSTGEAGVDWANVGSPTTTLNLSGTTISTSQVAASVTDGVTVSTNNDKTGYSLSQSFPSNFSSLAITAGGAVTAGTVSDKTGYSLWQSFPSNFSALAITAGGAVTAGTVSDKSGYSLSQSFPSNFSSLGITAGGHITTVDTVTTVTNQLTAAQIATGVWQDTTAGDFTASASIGKSIMNGVSLGTGLTVNDITTKTGFSLSSVGIQAIWDALTSALTAVGSVGKLLVDNVNATISSRLASGSYTAPDNSSITAIKTKTDQLVFSKTNELDVNIHSVNDVTVNGVGTSGSPWGP